MKAPGLYILLFYFVHVHVHVSILGDRHLSLIKKSEPT